jgi:hypothetical protein
MVPAPDIFWWTPEQTRSFTQVQTSPRLGMRTRFLVERRVMRVETREVWINRLRELSAMRKWCHDQAADRLAHWGDDLGAIPAHESSLKFL